MGDSIEDMLNVTMKRLDYIMNETDINRALKSEINSLMQSAIIILKSHSGEIQAEKMMKCWKKLQNWAKVLYIVSLRMPYGKPQLRQFHCSRYFMHIIIESKKEIKLIENCIKEADAKTASAKKNKTV